MSEKNRVDQKTPQIFEGRFPGLLGIEVLSVGKGEASLRMQLRPELFAPNGYLHAAAIVGLADSACGYGTRFSLPEGAQGFTTVELKSNFTGAAREGTLTCQAWGRHMGRRTQMWDANVFHVERDRTIAYFRCTQIILFD